MNHSTHVLGGATAWLGVCALATPGPLPLLAGTAVAALAAPWCDIDNLGAWRRRRKRGIYRTTRRRRGHRPRSRYRLQLIRWRKHPIRSRVAWLVSLLGEHRQGPCHSLLCLPLPGLAALIPILWIAAWPLWIPLAVMAGLASHILLDLANKKPVRLLWPLPLEVYGLGVLVGGATERWLVRPVLLISSVYLFILAGWS